MSTAVLPRFKLWHRGLTIGDGYLRMATVLGSCSYVTGLAEQCIGLSLPFSRELSSSRLPSTWSPSSMQNEALVVAIQ